MRRHQPAVKLCWRLLGLVRDDQLRIHAHVLTTIKSGESCDTPVPPRCARVSAGAGGVAGWPSEQQAGLPAALQARPLLKGRPAPQNCPCPGWGGGQGTVCLSNQRLQLVLIQSGPEFPFDPFGHLLPGSPGGFHVLEDGQRLSQRSILPLNFATLPSPQSDGHVPVEVIGQWPGMYALPQGPDSGFKTAGPVPVRALAGGATRRFLGCPWPPDLAASIAHLLLEL